MVNKTKVEIEKENEELIKQVKESKKQIEEMQKMMKQLMEEKEKAQTEAEKKNENNDDDLFKSIEDELNIRPDQSVRLVSLTIGGLNLKNQNGVIINFPEFGHVQVVRFEDLRGIYNNHSDLVKGGAFLIQSREAVKALYLDDVYNTMISPSRIEQIADLPADKIVDTIKSLPQSLRQTVVQKFVRGIASNDNRYLDHNKIKALNEYTGQDLYDISKNLAS